MTLLDFAAKLEKPRRKTFKTGDEGYIARCPNATAHSNGDKTLSFAVWWGQDDWLHLKCQRGCTEDEILGAMGLTQNDRKVGSSQTNYGPDAVYEYRDANGEYLFEKRRFSNGAVGKKDFRLYGRDPQGTSVSGVGHLGKQWAATLYNLQAVIEAVKSGATVYVNEGEKACDLLTKSGLVATCQPLGAQKGNPSSKWWDKHTDLLQGAKEVVIVADRDDVGAEFAEYVATQLKPVVGTVRIVQSATDREKDDAYDHFKAGRTVDEFVPYLKPHKNGHSGLALRSFKDIERKGIDWLWAPYLETGACALLAGDPGIGKSFILCALAAGISRGEGPPGFPKQAPGDVVLVCTEDESEQDIGPRLDMLNADVSRVYDVYDWDTKQRLQPPMTPEKMDMVIERVRSLPNPRLVGFDPIVEWFPANRNMNSANEAREVTARFRKLGQECRVNSLLVGHPNKGNGSLLHRFSGSMDFVAVVRSALYAAKVAETGERHVLHVKTNHGRLGKAIGYDIDDDGQFFWRGVSDVSEDQLASPLNPPVSNKAKDQARVWLFDLLKDSGAMDSQDVFKAGRAAGVGRDAIYKAKDLLNIKPRPAGQRGKWTWQLPEGSTYWWQDPKDDPFADTVN